MNRKSSAVSVAGSLMLMLTAPLLAAGLLIIAGLMYAFDLGDRDYSKQYADK